MAAAKQEDKVTDPARIDYDAAKTVVDRAADARKDGVAPTETDASGIVMAPDPSDNSVRSYNPEDVQREQTKPAERNKKYESGEPVHDRS